MSRFAESIDRSVILVTDFEGAKLSETEHYAAVGVAERLRDTELLRRMFYGDDAVDARFPRSPDNIQFAERRVPFGRRVYPRGAGREDHLAEAGSNGID